MNIEECVVYVVSSRFINEIQHSRQTATESSANNHVYSSVRPRYENVTCHNCHRQEYGRRGQQLNTANA